MSFDWSFNSDDFPGGDDSAGYLFNGAFTQLATNSGGTGIPAFSTSTITIPVVPGNTFGFRVDTTGNSNGPGVFTVNNFTATPVPFEFSPTLGLLALGGWFGRKKLVSKVKAWRSRG